MGECIAVAIGPGPPGPRTLAEKCGDALLEVAHTFASWDQVYEAWKEIKREEEIGSVDPGFGPRCRPAFYPALTTRLLKCGGEFYQACDFDDLARICPFDPAWEAWEWKQQLVSKRLESLEVEVKELKAKLPTDK